MASKGSLRYVDDGTVLAKIPSDLWVDWSKPRPRRVGRSEALRIVGFAFCISFVVDLGSFGESCKNDQYLSLRAGSYDRPFNTTVMFQKSSLEEIFKKYSA